MLICGIVHRCFFGSNAQNDNLKNNIIVSAVVFVAVMVAYFGLIFVLRVLGL